MPDFPFNTPKGTITINAPDLDTALEALKKIPRLSAPEDDTPVSLKGMASQGAASTLSGVAGLVGLPGTIGDYMESGLQKGENKLFELAAGRKPSMQAGGKPGVTGSYLNPLNIIERMAAGPDPEVMKKAGMREPGNIANSAKLRKLMSTLTGGYSDREPQNVPEEYMRTGGEFLPTALAFGGAKAANLIYNWLAPALTSETAGQLVRNYGPKRPDWMPDWVPGGETIARVAGAFAGPSVAQGGRKAITPNPATSDARLKAAEYFKEKGIPYSAGDKTGSTWQQYKESELGGPAYANLKFEQKRGIQREVLKKIGIEADEAAPDLMEGAAKSIGDTFKGLAQRNDLTPGSQLHTDIRDAIRVYGDKVEMADWAPIVKNTIREINDTLARHGFIPGVKYQSMITRLREAGQGANADLSIVTRKLRNALDDAMENSIRQHNPADLGAWTKARTQYRDLVAIEDTLATGEGGVEGLINPTKLRQVTSQQSGTRQAAQAGQQGGDTLADLAKHAKIMMQSKVPQSGTSPRSWLRRGGDIGVGATTGASLGAMAGGIPGALIGGGVGAVAGPAISGLRNNLIMSKLLQKYYGNQLIKPPPISLPTKLPKTGVPQGTGVENFGGLMRMLEQEQAAERAASKRRPKP